MPPASKGSSLDTQSNLDLYIKNSRPVQEHSPLVTSQEIRDRGSTFVANIFPATSPVEARLKVTHLKDVIHKTNPATHEMAAWRCMSLKSGCNGLGGPDDFELSAGHIDDGERWAGSKIQKVMESYGIIDAVVIVSRWYGGTMLGSARFSHIETCAAEVCQEFKRSEEMRECVSELTTLDAILSGLRAEYSELKPDKMKAPSENTTPPNYSSMDLDKVKRLLKARKNSINSVKLLLDKSRETTSRAAIGPDDHPSG
ncbi:hypothetical protein H0H92_010224 [Tricholoma furcatifolium]|nr:hypothetical protein H0H92_010224 [Tricholoma furcatifolium]